MDQLASMFFASRTQAHIFHLRVRGPGSFSAHKALNEYYDNVIEIVDGLVESYQGKYGIIRFTKGYEMDNDASIKNIIGYFKSLCDVLETLRALPALSDRWIQNQIDNLSELLYSTKYKLENLQ